MNERVARLEDEREILRTLHQYGEGHDYGPLGLFLDCFTEDGVWERRRRPVAGQEAPPRLFEAVEGLTRFYHSHARAPEIYYKHLVVDPRITLRGDEADVSSYYVKVDEHPDGPYIYAFGRYQDRLVRCSDGRWRLRHRLAHTEQVKVREWTAEHDHGARVGG